MTEQQVWHLWGKCWACKTWINIINIYFLSFSSKELEPFTTTDWMFLHVMVHVPTVSVHSGSGVPQGSVVGVLCSDFVLVSILVETIFPLYAEETSLYVQFQTKQLVLRRSTSVTIVANFCKKEMKTNKTFFGSIVCLIYCTNFSLAENVKPVWGVFQPLFSFFLAPATQQCHK